MVRSIASQPPSPPANHQDFERLCCALWRQIWGQAQLYGGPGVEQYGVDIYSQRTRQAIQCKLLTRGRGGALTIETIRAEVRKADEFPHELEQLIFATTREPSRKTLDAVIDLDRQRTAAGKFGVMVVGWEWIAERLEEYKVLRDRYLRDGGRSSPRSLPPPELASQWIRRDVLYADVVGKLLLEREAVRVGLWGMSGCGKSVLASLVAHDASVNRRFSDGVIWIPVGDQIALPLLGTLYRMLTGEPPPFTNPGIGKLEVRSVLAGGNFLLILDDVREQAYELDVIGPDCAMLVTTQDRQVLDRLGAVTVPVGMPSDTESLQLLEQWAVEGDGFSRETAAAIAMECGSLPLAMAMAGALAKQPLRSWSDALELLRSSDLDGLNTGLKGYEYRTFPAAVGISVADLPEDVRTKYLELAVFGSGWIPVAALKTFWGKDPRQLIGLFVNRALADLDRNRIKLHDLVVDYVVRSVGDIARLHRQLVESYRYVAGDDFASATAAVDDGYFFQKLPHHLAAAGLHDELEHLLFNFSWVLTKLRATDANAVAVDYQLMGNHSAAILVKKALRLAAPTLARSADQLANELLGRLRRGDPLVDQLLRGALASQRGKSWLRPTRPGLMPPGGCLQQTFAGNDGGTGRLVYRGNDVLDVRGKDGFVRTWNIESGTLKNFAAQGEGSDPIEPLPQFLQGMGIRYWDWLNPQRLATYDAKERIRMWDVSAERCIGEADIRLAGYAHPIVGIAALDERRVVTAAGRIGLWDLGEPPRFLRTLHAHDDRVGSIARIDSHSLASASEDGSVRIWSVDQAALAAEADRHYFYVDRLAATPRGIVSRAFDGRVLLWQIDAQGKPKELLDETGWAGAFVLLDSNHVAGSAHNGFWVWRLNPPKRLSSIPYNGRTHAITGIDSTRFAVGAGDVLHIWAKERPMLLAELIGHTDTIMEAASMEGRYVITASLDNTVRVWDVDEGREVARHDNTSARVQVAGSCAVFTAGRDDSVTAWNWRTGEVFEVMPGIPGSIPLAIHGNRVACVSRTTGALVIGDLESRTCVAQIGPDPYCFRDFRKYEDDLLAWVDEEHIVSASRNQSVRIWNLASGRNIATAFADSPIHALTSVPEIRVVAIGDSTGSVQIYKFETASHITGTRSDHP